MWRWVAKARATGHVDAASRHGSASPRRCGGCWRCGAGTPPGSTPSWCSGRPAILTVPAVPSLSTLHRAIRRDLTRGERAGLRSGEAARRAHDVFGQRPATHRNAVWEGDHKHVPVEVDVEGELATPWVTWFIDCATKAITGVAVTAHAPSRDAVLASLRIAITRSEPFGPVGGLPGQIRVDRGKEFLCATVTAAMGALRRPRDRSARLHPAPEGHHRGAERRGRGDVPRLAAPATPAARNSPAAALADPDAPPLTYEAFVGLLLELGGLVEHPPPPGRAER